MSGSENGPGPTATSRQCPVFHGPACAWFAPELPRVHAHVIGDEPQGEFAQRGEIGFAEKILRGGGGAIGQINLALVQTLDEFGGWQIHQFHHRVVEHAVGNGLANLRAGDLPHGVRAALDVLHVERGEDVNARIEQFRHILPAFGMTRAGRVGVREFVHERELRAAREHRIEIHFSERDAAMVELLPRNLRQAGGKRVGFLAPMCLDVANDNIAPSLQFAMRGLQHGVGFADAGAHAEKNLQPSAFHSGFLALDRTQQRIRIGSGLVGHTFRVSR